MPHIKGPEHSENENLYILAPAKTKRMQPMLVSREAPHRLGGICKKTKTLTGPVIFLQIAPKTVLRMTLKLVAFA